MRDADDWSTSPGPIVVVGPAPSEPRDRGDDFVAGGGGRSGGAGGGASWGDADAPVIVDPFGGGTAPAVDTAIASEGMSAERDDSSAAGDTGSSAAESSGPSY